MKTFFKSLILLTLSMIGTKAVAQVGLYADAGLTINVIDRPSSLGKQLGYYVGFSPKGKLNDYLGYSGAFHYISQQDNSSSTNFKMNSVNAAFYAKVYPFKKGLSLLGGLQGAIVTSKTKVSDEEDISEGQLYYTVGLSYDITERFEVIARFVKPTEQNFFKWYSQIGISYRVFNDHNE